MNPVQFSRALRASIAAAFSCATALAGTPAGAASVTDSPLAQVDRIFAAYSGTKAPGCAVGVFEQGKVVLARGYGAADIATGKPLAADSVFYAASVSKQFTVLAAATLVEQGRLRMEDDVRRWIPELPQYEVPITVAMLVHHTSGLRDFLGLFDLAGLNDYSRLDVPMALRMMTRQRGVNFTPGTQYSYSNGGYFLLAQTVARAAGMPFHEFARLAIFEPLGMKHTFFRHGANPAGANVAHGYVPAQGGGFEFADGYPAVSGSGGLMTTLEDLAAYDRDFHMVHKVWTPRVREIMLTPGRFTNGGKVVLEDAGFYYAGGLRVGTLRGQEWVAHSGGARGFRSYYALLPGLKFSVATYCNSGAANPNVLTEAVIDAFQGKALSGEWPPELAADDEPVAGEHPAASATLAAMVGRFRSEELDAVYAFAPQGDGLELTITSPYVKEPVTTALAKVTERPGGLLVLGSDVVHLERPDGAAVEAFSTADAAMRGIRFVRVP